MLIKAKTLKGYKISGTDGDVGKVKEFYFDDQNWHIRYLVADTGNWLTGNQVLISPKALVAVNKETECIDINLTKKQIEKSPMLNTDKPVSRQFELDYHDFFGWPVYWDDSLNPNVIQNLEQLNIPTQKEKQWDPHLRSTKDVSGHLIQAIDGEMGQVSDFIIDDVNWIIRYMIIDTKSWWDGKKVLVSSKWIEQISWKELKVFVNLSLESIKQSPEYSEEELLTRDYEAQLHKYYNRNVYWPEDPSNMNQKL